MTALQEWVKLPSAWIERGDLRKFRWDRGKGANNTAALMALAAIAHSLRPSDGVARLTYDELADRTLLSRAKLAAGLDVLEQHSLIEREPEGRSTYRLRDYSPVSGWAMFPARGLYRGKTVSAFADFRLRSPAELDALKLFYLCVGRRDRNTNTANITYEKIEELSGIASAHIKRAITVAGATGLLHVERTPSKLSHYGVSNAYRIPHISSRQHRGTIGRESDYGIREVDFDTEF